MSKFKIPRNSHITRREYHWKCSYDEFYANGGGDTEDSWDETERMKKEHLKEVHNIKYEVKQLKWTNDLLR